jgi:hypothetical protein
VQLSTEIASLQSDLKDLEADAVTDDADAYAKRITKLIEHLRAQGEAAYDLLQSTLPTDLDPAGVEIRRLELLATGVSGAEKAAIDTRIDELRSARATTQSDRGVSSRSERPSQQPPSSGG